MLTVAADTRKLLPDSHLFGVIPLDRVIWVWFGWGCGILVRQLFRKGSDSERGRRHMRRIGMMLGGVAAAGLLAVAVAQPASAAQGFLWINESPVEDPSGCYPMSGTAAEVENDTDSLALVFDNSHCEGDPKSVIEPGQDDDLAPWQSIEIS